MLDPGIVEMLKNLSPVKTIEAATPYYLASGEAGLIDST
jgi:hypothetical protein